MYIQNTYLLSKLQSEVSAATLQTSAKGITARTDIELKIQFIFMFITRFLVI
jgi:hypothetical protein